MLDIGWKKYISELVIDSSLCRVVAVERHVAIYNKGLMSEYRLRHTDLLSLFPWTPICKGNSRDVPGNAKDASCDAGMQCGIAYSISREVYGGMSNPHYTTETLRRFGQTLAVQVRAPWPRNITLAP